MDVGVIASVGRGLAWPSTSPPGHAMSGVHPSSSLSVIDKGENRGE